MPNDINEELAEEIDGRLQRQMKATFGPLLLYASPLVIESAKRYIDIFNTALLESAHEYNQLHPRSAEVNKAHNDLILAMQKDALGWSAFGFKGKTRVEKAIAKK